MKLQPKDIGIIAIVIAAGIVLTWFTVKKFGGEDQSAPPQLVGKASAEVPTAPSGQKAQVPNEAAN